MLQALEYRFSSVVMESVSDVLLHSIASSSMYCLRSLFCSLLRGIVLFCRVYALEIVFGGSSTVSFRNPISPEKIHQGHKTMAVLL